MKNRTVYSRNNKLNCETEVRVAIYCRLSKDDNLDSESESIQNQRKLLIDYCTEQGWKIVSCYEDDGISGLKMDTRPGLQRMLDDIRRGQIDLVITKDSSRLARNYLDFGLLFEKFFPKNHVRYIGLTDNVDSERDDGFIPIRAYFNEHYCRDISGKIHATYDITLREIITGYTKESGVRVLERRLAALCRKAAMEVVNTGVKQIHITEKNIEQYLGIRRYQPEKLPDQELVGVVNGLAWTSVGG